MAADMYKDIIYPMLKQKCGTKRSYTVFEDNDPVGYKSNKAKAVKAELGIRTHVFPRYSPDVNPLDFSIWSEVERKVLEKSQKSSETVESYKRRLRTTALSLPKSFVRKAIRKLATKIRELKNAKGGNISSD